MLKISDDIQEIHRGTQYVPGVLTFPQIPADVSVFAKCTGLGRRANHVSLICVPDTETAGYCYVW